MNRDSTAGRRLSILTRSGSNSSKVDAQEYQKQTREYAVTIEISKLVIKNKEVCALVDQESVAFSWKCGHKTGQSNNLFPPKMSSHKSIWKPPAVIILDLTLQGDFQNDLFHPSIWQESTLFLTFSQLKEQSSLSKKKTRRLSTGVGIKALFDEKLAEFEGDKVPELSSEPLPEIKEVTFDVHSPPRKDSSSFLPEILAQSDCVLTIPKGQVRIELLKCLEMNSKSYKFDLTHSRSILGTLKVSVKFSLKKEPVDVPSIVAPASRRVAIPKNTEVGLEHQTRLTL